MVQKDGTHLYFVQRSLLWDCPFKEDAEPMEDKGFVQADQLASNGQVLYVQWFDFQDFKNPNKVFAYDFNNNQRLEDKSKISTSRNIRYQHGYLFVETVRTKELARQREDDPKVRVEVREIDVFKESDPTSRDLTYIGTFRVPGHFNPPSSNAQLYGTMYTEMAYCPITNTLFAVADGKLFRGQLRSE